MTDEQIIKALENCGGAGECQKCPLNDLGEGISLCIPHLTQNALDLINRQKAEIEELKEENKKYREICEKAIKTYKETRAEAIKEFAERLRDTSEDCTDRGKPYVLCEDIDNLVKEMVGE